MCVCVSAVCVCVCPCAPVRLCLCLCLRASVVTYIDGVKPVLQGGDVDFCQRWNVWVALRCALELITKRRAHGDSVRDLISVRPLIIQLVLDQKVLRLQLCGGGAHVRASAAAGGRFARDVILTCQHVLVQRPRVEAVRLQRRQKKERVRVCVCVCA